jgi:hypothetical protein
VQLRWILALAFAAGCGSDETGTLRIRTLEGDREVPARVEVLDAEGAAFAATDALTLHFECEIAPLPEWLRVPLSSSDRLRNNRTGTEQFYTAGAATLELPPGRYRVRAFKGIEYRVARAEMEVGAGEEKALDIDLERWIDLPARGWYGVDDHVHITRRTREDDRRIATWMRAEDLHVANLLQMGTVDQFGVTPQHAFGDAHFLGHTITLGADRPVDRRDTYIAYETTFHAALEAGGLPGFAHFGLGPARDGIALHAPRGLVHFVEVLQFASAHYDVWYGLLDLGVRIPPTAGTDFPCGPWSVPGAERFYVRLPEAPTRRGLVEAVRAGHTFVTNGPVLDLRIGSAGIGEELQLAEAKHVPIEGHVLFDPESDDITHVELVRNGTVVPAEVQRVGPGEIRVDRVGVLHESAWWALRVLGNKLGARPLEPMPSGVVLDFLGPRITNFGDVVETIVAFHEPRRGVYPAAAHTAPIWVKVGASQEAEKARARPQAEAALARLAELEARLGDDRIEEEAIWDWVPYSDGVSIEHLRRNRAALHRAIADARSRYLEILDTQR